MRSSFGSWLKRRVKDRFRLRLWRERVITSFEWRTKRLRSGGREGEGSCSVRKTMSIFSSAHFWFKRHLCALRCHVRK